MNESKLKVAVISAGMIANAAHIPAYKSIPDLVELVAVCDVAERTDLNGFWYRCEAGRKPVKALIEAKIRKLGLGPFFEVTRDEIRGANGSLIVFRGMQSYNAENIKSLEDFDWAWIEEAQSLSKRSLSLLRSSSGGTCGEPATRQV